MSLSLARASSVVRMFHKRKKGKKERKGWCASGAIGSFFLSFFLLAFYETIIARPKDAK
jgi:hypothetical protein